MSLIKNKAERCGCGECQNFAKARVVGALLDALESECFLHDIDPSCVDVSVDCVHFFNWSECPANDACQDACVNDGVPCRCFQMTRGVAP